MIDVEACDVCGFVWAEVAVEETTTRLVDATERLAHLVRHGGPAVVGRPSADRWSALEYAQHIRDALFNLRDRIVLGVVVDNPVPHPMHGTARIEMGLYDGDSPEQVADELLVAAALFTRTFDRLPAGFGDRPIFYPYPTATTRTVQWVASQALHECEHHLADAQENVAVLSC